MASAQVTPPTSSPPNSTIAVQEPVFRRISYFVQLWGLQKLATVGVGLLRFFQPLPRHERPTLLKTYPVRPKLTNRVFIPQSHKAGEVLPLYIDIHGGGFSLCHPYFDDEYCAHFCNKYNILVISLDYSKAPQVAFPVPTDDIEALVDAVLLDESLPIDKTRVVIGGFSAGGNLSLSAVQAPALQGRIHGVVPWYPVIEWVTNTSQKLKTRPYRNKKDVDMLESMGPIFNWGYLHPGQDLTDPRLSVSYADKSTLPKWIFMIGVEYDMLCNEAKEMIMDVAELKGPEREAGQYEFERGTYRWRMVRDVIHGYNQAMGPAGGEGEKVRLQRVEETYAEVGEWLFKGPFAKQR